MTVIRECDSSEACNYAVSHNKDRLRIGQGNGTVGTVTRSVYPPLSPVHTNNNVEATLLIDTSRTIFSTYKTFLRQCCRFERVLREISSN